MSTGYRSAVRALPAVAALAAGVTACSGSAGSTAAARTAEDLLQAASQGDTAALCRLLAPATAHQLEQQESAPCVQAARSVDLGSTPGAGPAQVWGSSALVPTGSAAVFLIDVNGRWRVKAAGCVLREEQPADCQLGGG